MVRGEVRETANHRQKGGATVEQVRIAQVTQESGTIHDSTMTSQIKKVMELTRCSQADAEVALFDHDNNVEVAVLALLDRPENGNQLWKESKGRKTKKQELDKDDYQYGNRRGDGAKGNRGRNSNNFPTRPSNARGGGGGGPRQDSQGTGTGQDQQRRDGFRDRPGGQQQQQGNRANRNQKDFQSKNVDDAQKNNFPAIDAFTSEVSKEDENTWKNGPLVFEQSAPSAPPASNLSASNNNSSMAPATPSAPTQPKTEKLSFAAVAASKKVVVPPPPPPAAPVQQQQQPAVPSVSAHSQVSSTHSAEQQPPPNEYNQYKPDGMKEASSPSVRDYSSSIGEPAELVSTSVASTSFGAAGSNTVNKEFTDKLKNDIGIGLHSASASTANTSLEAAIHGRSPSATAHGQPLSVSSSGGMDLSRVPITTTRSNSLLHDVEFISSSGVEFISGDGPSILDFQFGFHPEAPAVDNLLKGRETLSFMPTNTISAMESSNYASNDLRGMPGSNNNGQQQQQKVGGGNNSQPQLGQGVSLQQQQQQQPQHNSLQQQQQQMYAAAAAAQFPAGYGIPYLYSPVASGMRDVDQLNSFTAMNPFPYGIGSMSQLEMQMNAMLPPSMGSTAAPQTGALNVGTQQNHQTGSTQHRNSQVDNNKFQQGNVNSSNGPPQSNNSFQSLGSQSQHQLRGQGMNDNGAAAAAAAAANAAAVAPPPGFSGPPFLTQPSFQSLFQVPSYTHPGQMSIPYFLQQGNTQQRQQQAQHAPQAASLQQQHHRPAEHAAYLDMSGVKYPQQQQNISTSNSNNSLPQSVNSQGYQGNIGGNPLQAGHQGLQQRNNQAEQYYNQKWSGNGGGWRA